MSYTKLILGNIILYLLNQTAEVKGYETGFNYTLWQLFNNLVEMQPNIEGAGKAPPSLDWREQGIITSVKDQQFCNSSYAFAAIGLIESLLARLTKETISLSVQQGIDCVLYGDCQYSGVPHYVLEDLFLEKGCNTEADYPYNVSIGNGKGECMTHARKIAVHIKNITQLMIYEDQMMDALAFYGPLVVAIYASPQIKNYSGGILDPTDCDKLHPIDHSVLLVGYGTENNENYWIIKNSWGVNWGEKGYLRLIRGKYACNIGEYILTAEVYLPQVPWPRNTTPIITPPPLPKTISID